MNDWHDGNIFPIKEADTDIDKYLYGGKLKRFFKQLFCKHDYKKNDPTIVCDGLQYYFPSPALWKQCKKCGKIQ